MNIEQMTDAEIQQMWDDHTRSAFGKTLISAVVFARSILAARDAQWNALIAGQAGHHEEQPDGTVMPVDPTDRGFKAEQAEAPSDDCLSCSGTGSGGFGVGCTDCLGTGRDSRAQGCPTCKRTDGNVCDWCPSMQPATEQAEAPSVPLCANCGKEGAAIHEGDAEGDVWCSSECYDQHGELGCLHETHNGFRHPVESRRLIECENVLRSLASWLSAGGYNAPTVDPKAFEEKIRWGVDEAIKDAVRIATQPAASNAGEREAFSRMIADFPALSIFHTKHALGPMTAPSCLCCGQLPESIAIKHAELPGIVICTKCRDATLPPASNAGEREAFEAANGGRDLEKTPSGEYTNPWVAGDWEVWREAWRAALASKPAEPVAPPAREALPEPASVKALREALALQGIPVGNMVDRHTAMERILKAQVAWQSACTPDAIKWLLNLSATPPAQAVQDEPRCTCPTSGPDYCARCAP